MEELPYYLGSALGLAVLAIAYLWATNSELRSNCKEWENRTLNLESDCTQYRIKIALQDEEIATLEQLKKEQLPNSILLEEENQALRAEFHELESTYVK